jgi:hypothetical protein
MLKNKSFETVAFGEQLLCKRQYETERKTNNFHAYKTILHMPVHTVPVTDYGFY